MDLEVLRPWNAHWAGGDVSPLFLKHPTPRAVVPRWVDDLLDPDEARWTLRPGPRQIGKTTSLGHVAQRLLEAGVPPRRVVLVPLDQEPVLAATQGRLDRLLEAASERAGARPGAPVYLLLDEVQEFPDWAPKLKAAWDRYHPSVRVLATGSSAMHLLRPATADFPGRIRTVTVHPMKFREAVADHPGRREAIPDWDDLVAAAKAARASLKEPEAVAEALEDFHGSTAREGARGFLRARWLEHCAWGGYPAARAGARTTAARLEFFDAAWNAVVAKDLRGTEKVREFRMLLRHIGLHPGGRFEPYKLQSRLGVRGETVAHWKALLEDVMLVQQLPPLLPRLAPDQGKDKAYPNDPGWISFWRGHLEDAVDPHDPLMGAIVETVIVDHARRLRFNVVGTTALPEGYVQRPEVDVAVDLGGHWLLIESKYSARPRQVFPAVGGPDDIRVVVTRDTFATGGGLTPHLVPAHEFAMFC